MLSQRELKQLDDSKAAVKLFEQQTKIVKLENKIKRLKEGIKQAQLASPVGTKACNILE